MTATAQEQGSGMRDWWLRTLLVLQRPRPVFVALRDESRESLSDRSEQVLLVVWLAGIAYALASPTASHLMDDSAYDGLLVAIWACFAFQRVNYGIFSACITAYVVLLLSALNLPTLEVAEERLVATMIGAGIALAIHAPPLRFAQRTGHAPVS